MGIKGLNTFIKKICPECMSLNNISKYNGKTFAIDASILLYKFRYMAHINESLYITGLLNRIHYYLINNIIPVFVFDGVPPIEKKETLKKRSNIKQKIKSKIEALESIDSNDDYDKFNIKQEITKLNNQLVYVNKYHILECKKLLTLLGIPFVTAPDEAEKYCVFLYNKKLVDYIVTDDTDVLTFGGINVLKTNIKNNIQAINLNILLNKLNYSNEKFIDFCILSGCDYLTFIPNLGINTVYSLFKKNNNNVDNIDNIIKLNKYNFPENYNYKNVRKIFLEFNYDIDIIKFELAPINYSDLELFLLNSQIKNTKNYINKFKFNLN